MKVAFHPTSVFMATASADCSIRVWEICRSVCTHSFRTHSDVVNFVSFCPNPSLYYLCSASLDRTVCVHGMQENKTLFRFEGHTSPATACEFIDVVPNVESNKKKKGESNTIFENMRLLSGSRDGTLCVWSLTTGKLLKVKPFLHEIETIHFFAQFASSISPSSSSSNSSFILCGTRDAGLHILAPQTLEPMSPFLPTSLLSVIPTSHAKAKQSPSAVVVTTEQTIFTVSLPSLETSSYRSANLGELIDMKWLPPKYGEKRPSTVALASNVNEIRLLHLPTLTFVPLIGHEGVIMGVDVACNGMLVASASKDRTVRVWLNADMLRMSCGMNELQSQTVEAIEHTDKKDEWICIAVGRGHSASVTACSFAQKYTKMTYNRAKCEKVYDALERGKMEEDVNSSLASQPSEELEKSHFTLKIPGFIVSVSEDKTMKRWNLSKSFELYLETFLKKENGTKMSKKKSRSDQKEEEPLALPIAMECQQSVLAHSQEVTSLAVSPNNSMIATGSEDKTLKLWKNCSDQKMAAILREKKKSESESAFDKTSMARSDDASNAASIMLFGMGGVSSALSSSLLSSSSSSSSIQRFISPHITLIGHRRGVFCVTFSPTDAIVASSSGDSTIRIWDVHNGSCLRVFEGHVGAALHVEFFHPTPSIAPIALKSTGDEGKSIKDEEDATQIEAATVASAPAVTHSVQIASSGADGSVRLWSLVTGECLKVLDNKKDFTGKKRMSVLNALSKLKSQAFEMDEDKSEQSEQDGLEQSNSSSSSASSSTAEEEAADNNEVNENEGHGDRVWSMSIWGNGDCIVSGAADGSLMAWIDVTDEKNADEKRRDEEEKKKQELLAHEIMEGRLDNAFKLAIELGLPGKMHTVVQAIISKENGKEQLQRLVSELNDRGLGICLQWISEWNTNTRFATVSQAFLNSILLSFTPEQILSTPKAKDAVEALIPYTQRHLDRLNRLLIETKSVSFTAKQMRLGYTGSVGNAHDYVSDLKLAAPDDESF
eukprot:MONOS_12056.1-p1 / transcript=MONOS_12056.1 / gene=MONOS_12056 / organism=Monocercomonoides_exilis_PA203 / gene_product=WD repeat-containing protein SAZD / transcript_product=WD repeat-containing protein SAZD / location=Mono_scaffold00640:26272-29360(+) / protein_length=1000 / sequence_SO=supercontig / SO=protein_coding / is_pseudo=false